MKKAITEVNEKMVEGNKVIYIQKPDFVSLIKTTEVTIYDEPYEVSKGDIRFKTFRVSFK